MSFGAHNAACIALYGAARPQHWFIALGLSLWECVRLFYWVMDVRGESSIPKRVIASNTSQPRFISLNTPSGSAHLVSAADYPIESEKQIAAAQVYDIWTVAGGVSISRSAVVFNFNLRVGWSLKAACVGEGGKAICVWFDTL